MLNVKPKKHLGQHFLTDGNIASRITALSGEGSERVLYEIGPGKGVLTTRLTGLHPRLHLLEIDPESVVYLNALLSEQQVEIHEADVLNWDFSETAPEPFDVIGNLPYNITSPIFFHLLEHRARFHKGVFMIQKEVADRICSPPGTRATGILSVLISAYYEIKYHFTVQAGSFFPPPKVKSAVISLKRIPNPPDVEFARLKALVKLAFGQRRKTLRNALSSLNFKPSPELDLLLNKRAEQLPLESFLWLEKQWI